MDGERMEVVLLSKDDIKRMRNETECQENTQHKRWSARCGACGRILGSDATHKLEQGFSIDPPTPVKAHQAEFIDLVAYFRSIMELHTENSLKDNIRDATVATIYIEVNKDLDNLQRKIEKYGI